MSKLRAAFRKVYVWLLRITLALMAGSILSVLALRWMEPPVTAFMVNKTVSATLVNDPRFEFRHQWVPYDAISVHAKLAVMASEDQRFPDHHGFDFQALADAWDSYQSGGRLRGGSTISQQLAKNLFLWPGRSFFRKGLEAWFTVLIELTWPKQRILEVYLNVAEFGPGIFGVEAAAQAYFHKPASRLTAAEAALLAAVLPNPIRYRVDRPSRYVSARQAWILRQMARLGQTHVRKVG